jgi:hypothetical protein
VYSTPWEAYLSKNLAYVLVVYCGYAVLMVLLSAYRRAISNREFFSDGYGRYFRTNGRIVVMTAMLSFGLYIVLFALLLSIP